MNSEIWRPVPGFGNHYEASNVGNIMVRARAVEKKTRYGGTMIQRYAPRLLKRTPDGGYATVHLGWDNRKAKVKAAVLVLLAFRGSPRDGDESCHKNGDSMDDRLDNLYWGTHTQNMEDRQTAGRYAVGAYHPMAKLTAEQAGQIRSGYISYRTASASMGIGRSQYYRIRRGETRW